MYILRHLRQAAGAVSAALAGRGEGRACFFLRGGAMQAPIREKARTRVAQPQLTTHTHTHTHAHKFKTKPRSPDIDNLHGDIVLRPQQRSLVAQIPRAVFEV